jgi:hypothetical protein
LLLVIDADMLFRVFRRVVCSYREIGHVFRTLGLARIVFAEIVLTEQSCFLKANFQNAFRN